MSRSESVLQRLFESARRPDPSEPEAMPERLQNRLLARWRGAELADHAWLALAALYRRALLCACLAMALCVAWAYGELTAAPDNDVALANYELRADVMP